MTFNNTDKQPSTSNNPDLDWSQVRETVRMLHLCIAQIDMSLRDGDDSIQKLSSSFTSMIDSVNVIGNAIDKFESYPKYKMIFETITQENNKVSLKMQDSVIAFQFYDKLSQRLSHVSHALGALADLVGDDGRLYNPCEWSELQSKIRARYSMREEQDMFDLLLSGATIEAALERGLAVIHEAEDGDVELF